VLVAGGSDVHEAPLGLGGLLVGVLVQDLDLDADLDRGDLPTGDFEARVP
jgi:hypothetical protein